MSGQDIAKTFLRQLASGGWTCKAGQSHYIERWSNDYAIEQGYELAKGQIGILAANWNNATRLDGWTRVDVCTCMERVLVLAEKLGYECEWSDEWDTCSDCGKLLRTQPNCYGWRAAYWLTDGGIYCRECSDDREIAAECIGNWRKTLPEWIEPESVGYHVVGGKDGEREYENGFHPGQNDEPQDVADKLEAAGIKRYVFVIGGIGQFDVSFGVAVRKRDLKRAEVALGVKVAGKTAVKAKEMSR